jgi:uncharacterized membrane protein
MKKDTSLKAILAVSVAGMAFSGYLSYTELIRSGCIVGGCTYLLGLPTCVYGFFMYTLVFLISILGLKSKG